MLWPNGSAVSVFAWRNHGNQESAVRIAAFPEETRNKHLTNASL
jgi:hypothetical protein